MESPNQLPRLPSERKAKAAELEQPGPSHVVSPTQVSNLELKASESEDAYETPLDNSPPVSPQRANQEQYYQDRIARDEQIDQFATLPPLPTSKAAEQLLRFMHTTTQFMNTLEAAVGERLDSCSGKIKRLDRKVSLLESKRGLLVPMEPTPNEEDSDEE